MYELITRQLRMWVCVAATLILMACQGDGYRNAGVVELTALEDALTAGQVERFGSRDGTHVIGAVMAARVTPDGTRVVVLDRDPPYLKVFRRDGSLEGQYVERGGGPLEMPGVASLAVDDQRAFIVGPNVLMVAALDGGSRFRATPDFPLVDIGADCDGRVIGYGPRGRPEPLFLHQLRVDSSVTVVSSSLRGQATPRLAWGFGRSGIVGSTSGSVISHRLDRPSTPLFLSCDGGLTEQAWSWAVAGFPSRRASDGEQAARSGSVVQMTVDATAPINLGAAELPSGSLLWLEHRMLPSAGASGPPVGRLEWFLVDSAGIRRGYTSQRYVLQDLVDGVLLLSTSEPWPQVVLLPSHMLEELVAQGSWRSRD